MRNRILNLLKWAWLLIVLAVAGWYFYSNFSELNASLATMHAARLLGSFFLILIGRALSAHLTFESLKMVSHPIRFKEAFSIAAVTQLGKYLPGGIWHFAGKLGVYKARGMSVKDAAKPVILENIWLFASAIIAGCVAFLLSNSDLLCKFTPFLCGSFSKAWLVIPLLLLWLIGMVFINRWFDHAKPSITLHLKLCMEQILMWVLFGLSFWMLFPGAAESDFLLLSTAAFSISWLAGYAAVFAPGGIGIREAVLALLLVGFFPSESIAVHASVHRLLWVAAELILAASSALFFGIPLGMKQEATPQEDTDQLI